MANGTIRGKSALDSVENLGKSNDKEVLKNYEKLEAEKKRIRLKYAKDEEQQRKKLIEAEKRFEEQSNKKSLKERIHAYKEAQDDIAKYSVDSNERVAAKFKSAMAASLESISQAAVKSLSGMLNSGASGINDYIGAYSKYMSGIEARLQGSTHSFSSMTDMIRRNIGSSQYVSQTKMLQNLSTLVEQGIAYNVEQRAFLATISDKIATTFDAFDSNLAQIIRIQQADSTAARLGLEAQLTQFFNKNFGDTSYLSTLFDTVSASLLGAESQLGRNRSVEFEYTVQKWLGSLSSVGVSDATIQQLAQGLNYLGTGNVSALAGNTQLQNLLVMASQQAGLDYANLLTGGISSTQANQILQGVVSLGQQMAQSSNQVVKAAYANIFGINVSDMAALMNLSAKDLKTISSNMLSYTAAEQETVRQLGLIPGRMSLSERINTMFENVTASMGETIANNTGTYATWLLNSLIMGATGGGVEVNVPFLGAVNLNKAIQGGIVGLAALSNVGSILSGLSGRNNLSLNNWGASEQNLKSSGWGFNGITTIGAGRTTSSMQYVASSETGAVYESSWMGAREQQETVQAVETSNTGEQLDNIQAYTKSIWELLNGVTEGRTIRVSLSQF